MLGPYHISILFLYKYKSNFLQASHDFESDCEGDFESDCEGDFESDCEGDLERECVLLREVFFWGPLLMFRGVFFYSNFAKLESRARRS